MNRPILQAFMILCALFWTVMSVLPLFTGRKPEGLEPSKEIVSRANRTENQTIALGLMVVSWIGVAVLRMGKSQAKTT